MDGLSFDSRAEARRYAELRLAERAGELRELAIHPAWPLVVNGVPVGRYEADFSYLDSSGALVVEDVKGRPTRTAVYRLKAKLMQALHGITVREVME